MSAERIATELLHWEKRERTRDPERYNAPVHAWYAGHKLMALADDFMFNEAWDPFIHPVDAEHLLDHLAEQHIFATVVRGLHDWSVELQPPEGARSVSAASDCFADAVGKAAMELLG